MAIAQTTLEIREGTTASGTLVGQQVVAQGSPSSMNADISSLGVNLSPGKQYNARAKILTDDQWESDFCAPYPFRTLILAELGTIGADCDGGLAMDDGTLTYDTHDANIYPVTAGVYVSKNASGAASTKITARSIQDFTGQDFNFGALDENTLYYIIPWVVDQDGREYAAPWSDAESARTKYAKPVLTPSNFSHTSRSMSGNVEITTNSVLGSAYFTIQSTGGGTVWRKNLTATTGLQTWDVDDGDTDADGNTITIQPSTSYRLTFYAVNGESGGCTGSAQATVTTDQQTTGTVAITGVDNITPHSARVLLSYGDGQSQQDIGGEAQ